MRTAFWEVTALWQLPSQLGAVAQWELTHPLDLLQPKTRLWGLSWSRAVYEVCADASSEALTTVGLKIVRQVSGSTGPAVKTGV